MTNKSKKMHERISNLMKARGFEFNQLQKAKDTQASSYWIGEDLLFFFTRDIHEGLLCVKLTKNGKSSSHSEIKSVDLETYIESL